VQPEEELQSADAIATLVSDWTACANRSKGSGVRVEAEGIGESGSRMFGGLGEGGVTHQTCLVLWTWRKLADETNAKNTPKIC